MRFLKKGVLFVVIILLMVFAFSACSARSSDNYSPTEPGLDNDSPSDESEDLGTDTITSESRKIIYSVEANLSVNDFDKSVKDIENLLAEDEWFDYQSVSDSYAYYIARIKTTRLDAFIDSLSAFSTNFNYTKSANDISLNYTGKENRIAALNEEKNLILTYAETLESTPYEFLQRIAQINTEIARLNGDLNQYDSLMEYSEVSIRVNQIYTPEELAYKERANNVFYQAWEAFGDFFKFIGLAIIAIFPFLLVIAPVTCGIIFLVRYKKRKPPFDKMKKKGKKEENSMVTEPIEKAEGNDKL